MGVARVLQEHDTTLSHVKSLSELTLHASHAMQPKPMSVSAVELVLDRHLPLWRSIVTGSSCTSAALPALSRAQVLLC